MVEDVVGEGVSPPWPRWMPRQIRLRTSSYDARPKLGYVRVTLDLAVPPGTVSTRRR